MSEASTIENNQNAKKDILDHLLKPEVQESLNTLVEELPKLTEMVSVLTKYYDIAQSLATDELLKSDTVHAIKDFADPLKKTAKTVASTAIEAKDRAEESNEVIGLFGMLRMLKDPQVQKLLRFAHAYLEITSEHESQK